MNKKQLRETIVDAIQYADKQDATAEQRPRKRDYYECRFDHLNSFLIGLQVNLGRHDPELEALIKAFHSRVIYHENPLLDAADSNNEKPE